MGAVSPSSPVLLICAVISRYDEAIDWAREKMAESWGPIGLTSDTFPFDDTQYYTPSMGPDLMKCFFAFEKLGDGADLPDQKHQTNRWEIEYAASSAAPEPRPLNLDCGYLTEAKLVLATTKDRDHRLYLREGIYAEVTLVYHHKAWHNQPWTYPDYQRPSYHEFFDSCRAFLRQQLSSAD